jgi:hypothetical protein
VRFGLRRFRAKQKLTPFVTHRALTRALPLSLDTVRSFRRRVCFCPLRSGEEQKQAGNGRKEKTMKLEEINNRTKDAINHLIEALEAGAQ